MQLVRATLKAATVAVIVTLAVVDFFLRVYAGRRGPRAKWQQRWARAFARVLDLHVETIGLPPSDGFLLSNHVSYLDIVALATTGPMTFVSKADVRKWPVFGLLARWNNFRAA